MSLLDYKRRSLSPHIWEGEQLRPQVRAFILGMVKENFPGSIGAYILGSITTKHWTNASDVDINIIYPDNADLDAPRSVADSIAKQKVKVPMTPHIIGFYVSPKKDVEDNVSKSPGAYNLTSGSWNKPAEELYVDPRQHEKKFQKQIEDVDIGLGELRRDMRDIRLIIETFKHAPEDQQQQMLEELERKKDEIEEDLKNLTEEYDDLHQARLRAFEKEVKADPNAVNKHLYNQTLPGNVIFKMMERYGYRDLLERLHSIYESMPRSTSSS